MSKEAMKLALEHAKRDERHMNHAETRYWCRMYRDIAEKAIEALAEQPAQQEPVAFLVDGDLYYPEEIDWETLQEQGHTVAPLYTSPPPQQEPMALKWQQAPVKTQWGDGMVVASVAIDKDHTVCLYCERDQATKVEAMFVQRTWVGLTDEQIEDIWADCPIDWDDQINILTFARAIEAAHGIKENT